MIPIDSIKDILAPYEFGVLGLILNSTDIEYDSNRKIITIDKVYPDQPYARMGECIELANDAHNEIREKHPELYVLRAKVESKNDLGTGATAPWFVLFVSETDILKGKDFVTNRSEVESLLSPEQVMVHPTLKRVIPLSEAGVNPLELYSSRHEMKVSANVYLQRYTEAPFYLTSDGTLVHLGAKFGIVEGLYLNFQSPEGSSEDHDLDSKDLDEQIQDEPRLISGVEALRAMEWIRTQYPILERWK